ncbi:nuclease-related domain-containing protein [Jeotgalibacillus sp. JSM ZJ347]|uniref:nuclease-related domain-containing protein n=1 Tax=Jeotgalibacillus sp. JSM ZJ347 TaxID=3342117 RepID=UPI0035A8778B
MILKPRILPKTIQTLQCINNRLPDFHPSKPHIEKELGQCLAGFHGEKSSDYYLTMIEPEPLIICDLRLKYKGMYFQIDTMLICPNAVIIFEIKYIKGTIEIKSHYDQTLRTLNGIEEGFPSFKLQAERQADLLSKWLKHHCNLQIPVIPYVVMGNLKTIVKAEMNEDLLHTISMQAIPKTVHQLMNEYQSKKISAKKAIELGEKLIQAHEENVIDWYKKFSITFNDLIKGFICPSCKAFHIMKKARKCWCNACNLSGIGIYEYAVEEAFLLLGEGLTNRQFRMLFKTASNQSVKRLLKKMELDRMGTGSGTKYFRRR